MPTSQVRIVTARSTRFLAQFCKHAAAMDGPRGHRFRPHGGSPAARGEVTVHAKWSDTDGTVTLTPCGTIVLHASDEALTIRIDASDHTGLQRIQDIVTADLDRFGRQELVVQWCPVDTADMGHGSSR